LPSRANLDNLSMQAMVSVETDYADLFVVHVGEGQGIGEYQQDKKEADRIVKTIIVEYPETIPIAANLSVNAFESEARKAMAMKLYELGRVTSGQAAQLAGMGRVEFLLTCREMGVPSVSWGDGEIEEEFETPA